MFATAARCSAFSNDNRSRRDLENALAQEQAIRQQLVQAEKLGALGRMVSSVAHELNNPLQTIKNCLYLTGQELSGDSPIHDYLEMAHSETQRLVHLVAQLRELYRPRTAGPVPHDLAHLLRSVRTLMAHQLLSGRVQWQQPAHLPSYQVCIVSDRLKQVFINLATNAIEAMQPEGGQLLVDMAPSADGRQVSVSFRDTGPGIAPEQISRIFDDPYQKQPVEVKLIRETNPVDAVLREARDHDLVIIGVSERFGLESRLRGRRPQARRHPCALEPEAQPARPGYGSCRPCGKPQRRGFPQGAWKALRSSHSSHSPQLPVTYLMARRYPVGLLS